MCEPNPITLLRISFLNPVTTATERIITNNPNAIPKTAKETIDSENFLEVPLAKKIRRAMNSSVLNFDT